MRTWWQLARVLAGIGVEIGPAVVSSYVVVSASAVVAPLLLALGLRPLVDGVLDGDRGQVVGGGALMAVAFTMTVLAPAGYRWATIRQRELEVMVMQRRLAMLATRAPRLEHFERPEFWDRLRVLTRNAQDLGEGMALGLIIPIVVIQVVVTAMMLARLHPGLAVLPLVAFPAIWLAQRSNRLIQDAELRTAADRRTAERVFATASTAGPGKDVRLYALQGDLLDLHARSSRAVHHGIAVATVRAVAVKAAGWLLFAAAFTAAAVIVLRSVASGLASPGDVAFTLASAGAMVGAAASLTDLTGSASRIRATTQHYLWLAAQAGSADSRHHVPPRVLQRGIEFDEVSFSYAGSDRRCLSDVSLQLPAGKVVAVVGANGAGKTTLVKLLCGMYEPEAGRIAIDGVDLAGIELDTYRGRIAAGFQDYMRYELSVREAVGVGDIPRIDDRAAISATLTNAEAGFVDRLPFGLDTQLGTSWDGGVDLSGGEWQKLALARAMLRTDPLLVILDEPSAALDPQTEHALFEQIAADAAAGAAHGRVTLLISHRFSTVRMADLIVVLDNGRVREQGSHDELIALGGLYAELFRLQAHAYR